jgi:hypothetical protein
MVKKCIACDNRENRSKNVSFHRFPTDKNQQHQWLKRLNQLNVKDVSNKRVCGLHFHPSSYLIDSTKKNNDNGTQNSKKRLKQGALPLECVSGSRMIDSEAQTDLDMISLSTLFEKLTIFEQNVITSTMSIERFQNDDYNINYFTGFRSYKIFKMLFELLEVRKIIKKRKRSE